MGSFEELRNSLQTYQTMSPFFTHMVGTDRDEQIVVTGLVREFYERYPAAKKPLIQTNHYCHKELKELNPEEFFDAGIHYWDTYERERILKKRMLQAPNNFKTARERMVHPDVTHKHTQHQMLLQPATGEFQVWVRR
jgi:hypothetical protein